ncbi:MAG: hypothetical protein ABFQ62_01440 [Patescibacteria group bacterium]
MRKIVQITLALLLIAAMSKATSFAQSSSFPNYEECEENYDGKLLFCHATSAEDNPYVLVETACEAVYGKNGNAGHLDENGTPLAGHENDVMADENGDCPGDEEEPEPTETPIPTETPDPTDNPEPSSSPDPESGKHSALGFDVNCYSNNFDVVMDLKENGNPVGDKEVTFTYTSSKTAKTNQDGRARVSFAVAGDKTITATVNDFSDQSLFATMPKDCDPQDESENKSQDENSGSVLGTSTNNTSSGRGQVLGISTLADTGNSQTALINLSLIAGASINLIALAKSAYGKKN